MKPLPETVSASIVTYNNQSLIRKILDCLKLCKLDKVYVVDNNSSDSTADIVCAEYPEVELIRLNRNVGFGAANNVAINRTGSTYHIIMNPDVTVTPENLLAMEAFMNSHNDVAVITPKVLNPDGTEQFLPKLNPKFRYILSGRLENRSRYFYEMRSRYTFRSMGINEPVNIDLCTGCFMFSRTSMLKKCGGFDERYFMYLEDADLTREIKKFGRTVYVPSVYVTHEWKRDSVKSLKGMRMHIASMLKYILKWAGRKA